MEALVIDAVRRHLQASGTAPSAIPDPARELIEHHVERVMLAPQHIHVQLRQDGEAPVAIDADAGTVPAQPNAGLTSITIAWTRPNPTTVNGIIHVPAHNTPMKP
jgi:hypothetical protein